MIGPQCSDGFKGALHSICVSIPPRVTWIISIKCPLLRASSSVLKMISPNLITTPWQAVAFTWDSPDFCMICMFPLMQSKCCIYTNRPKKQGKSDTSFKWFRHTPVWRLLCLGPFQVSLQITRSPFLLVTFTFQLPHFSPAFLSGPILNRLCQGKMKIKWFMLSPLPTCSK